MREYETLKLVRTPLSGTKDKDRKKEKGKKKVLSKYREGEFKFDNDCTVHFWKHILHSLEEDGFRSLFTVNQFPVEFPVHYFWQMHFGHQQTFAWTKVSEGEGVTYRRSPPPLS